ncbi:MAG TPA: protein adenylyltransferase SelO family protein [Bdellovibrionota bacterium]|jgi:uncharacterized protein YdiU (UPF0061 family)
MRPAAYKWNIAALNALSPETGTAGPYSAFSQIDGTHPWKFAVPSGFVDYQARVLRGTKIVYFNFPLAMEMGLIPVDHPHRMNPALEREVISSFALRILNEHDQLTGVSVKGRDLKPNRYMATRYLQLQHDCKKGATSGDGRSVWNGQFVSLEGVAWDISSCGTGVTRLSPGFAHGGKPVRTGDPNVSYGSGLAEVDEGLTAAILSESFHSRGILTERTLVVLETPDGDGINVRAAKNLLRPSHLFLHLKQGNQLMLRRALDFYIAKQSHNGDWEFPKEGDKYDHFLSRIAAQYGRFAARLEDEYIFCWLDWDGDNMLLDGGIIDYGSIRQFGLCHHRYRYDDVERFSTNLKEQRQKARYLVQTCVQLIDFVRTGQKKHLSAFADSPYLAEFDSVFEATLSECLLKRIGLAPSQRLRCMTERPKLVAELSKAYRFFERRECPRGLRRVADGVNSPAIFCVRSLLRELPRLLMIKGRELDTREFLGAMKTPYLTKKEMKASARYSMPAARFQRSYLELLRFAHKGRPLRRALLETTMRASQHNRTSLATGDAIIHVVDHLLSKRQALSRNEVLNVIDGFIRLQQGRPIKTRLRKEARRMLSRLLAIVEENKFSI